MSENEEVIIPGVDREQRADAPDVDELETVSETLAEVPLPSHMRTILQQFSESFLSGVEPIMDPLGKVEQVVARTAEGSAVKEVLPELRNVRHHLRALMEKVREQHAYVLIFGPLKSGKSTLMNTICASYVSEVTALPAYPCLVHVNHAERPQFRVTRYDGSEEVFTSQDVLHEVVESGHSALTRRLREVEESGAAFEPSLHMPSALRCIDVNLPSEELATSGAVLVDTPGLYSRMKFGYDQMTKDFRNAAACAIFVVKSDNLFLEQVFDEFTDLLDMFSRIFLIVNLDSRKSDLSATGELVPSLEREDPNKIIQAFRDLAMSAPLKQAVDDGRLQIYPVDLLNAASTRIRQAAGKDVSDACIDDYRRLSDELTDYLNSSDYLREFLSDSLYRATSLMDDAEGLLQHPSFDELDRQVDMLKAEHRKVSETKDAIDRLDALDWSVPAKPFRDMLTKALGPHIDNMIEKAGEDLTKAVDAWWATDSSLNDLSTGSLVAHKKQSAAEFVLWFKSAVHAEVSKGYAGLEVGDQLTADLQRVGIDLASIGRAVLAGVTLEQEVPLKDAVLNVDEIPVRKGFFDWLLFRSTARVRRILFGKDDALTKSVAATVKEKRLREEGRAIIDKQCAADFVNLWSEDVRAMPMGYLDRYLKALETQLVARLKKASFETAKLLGKLEEQIHSGAVVTEQAEATRNSLVQTAAFVKELHGQYGVVDYAEEVPEDIAESVEKTEHKLVAEESEAADVEVVAEESETDNKKEDDGADNADVFLSNQPSAAAIAEDEGVSVYVDDEKPE